MEQPISSDDLDPSIHEAKLQGWQRYMVDNKRLKAYLQDYLKSTKYSAYEKVEMMLSMYVSNPWYTPDTSELKQYLLAISADVRFELLKKQYGWSHYTALHEAAERGHVEVMRCMLEMVEPENQIQLLGIPNEYNKTSLDVAEGEETVQLIKQYIESAVREIAEGKSPRDLSYVLNDLSLEERQSLMSDERLRSITFLINWPHDSNLSGVKMAQAGFYCVDDYDRVQCTFCHGYAYEWEAEDNPMTEHIKLFPSCPFVKGFELGIKEYKNENNTDKRDVTTETSGELLEDSGDLKDAEEQIAMQSNEKESSLPATSVDELVGGERWDVLLEPADEINGITEDMDISFQDTVVESKHSAVVNNVQPDSVLVQELKLKITELKTELAGYQSDAGRGSHELRDTVEGQIVSLTGVEVSSTTSDRTHNKDIAGTHKSLVNEDGDETEHNSSSHSVEHGDEPEHNLSSHSVEGEEEPELNPSSHSVEHGDETDHNLSSYSVDDGEQPERNSSSYSAGDEAYCIFSSTADEQSLHLIHLMNIWKDINVTVKEITQNIDIVNPENIDLSLPDSTLFKPDVEPALSEVLVKVKERPEDNEMRDQISELTQQMGLAKLRIAELEEHLAEVKVKERPEEKEMRDQNSVLRQQLGLAKLRIAELEEQLAAIRDICDGLICVSPSNAAAATQQDVNGTQQSDLSVTTDAVEEVGAEMDIRVRRGSDSSLEEED